VGFLLQPTIRERAARDVRFQLSKSNDKKIIEVEEQDTG